MSFDLSLGPLFKTYESFPVERAVFVANAGVGVAVGKRSVLGVVQDYLVRAPGAAPGAFVPARLVTFTDNVVPFPARPARKAPDVDSPANN